MRVYGQVSTSATTEAAVEGTTYELRIQRYPSANKPEERITGLAAGNTGSRGSVIPIESTQYIQGPARVRAYVTPGNVNVQSTAVEFGTDDL